MKRNLKHGKTIANGGRMYSYEVKGHYGWTARYVKEVDESEFTLRFYQEIYDNFGRLAEVHEKYPVNKGHEKIGEVSSYED